jgi:inner membrane protein
VDNVTHTLCGLALARACGSRIGPLGTATLVVAANLPDLDIVSQAWGGRPAYLCHHRGLTHAVLGLSLQALLLSWLMTRWGRARGHDPRPRGLLLAACLGLGSHLLLDGLNTYGVRPWLPFDATWYYGDVAFIVDPWLWLCFGAGAALGTPPTRWGRRRWWFWNGVGTGVLFFGAALTGTPLAAALVWGTLMPLALIARERDAPAPRLQVASLAGLGLAVLYLLGLGVSGRVAASHARRVASERLLRPLTSTCSSSLPAVPWRFRVVVTTDDTLLPVDVDLLSGQVEAADPEPRGLEDAGLTDLRDTPEYQAWRLFSRQPFVRRVRDRLLLDDARYGWPDRPGWSHFELQAPASR